MRRFTMSNERVEISTFFKNLEVPKHGAVRLAGNVSTGDTGMITTMANVVSISYYVDWTEKYIEALIFLG